MKSAHTTWYGYLFVYMEIQKNPPRIIPKGIKSSI